MDSCTDVNIMPASVYKLVFNDSELKKIAPSNLEIGTYTNDTVKIVGSCLLYLVHLEQEMMVVSCCLHSTLMLRLIQPYTRLDYSPHRASLITSSLDHPRKTKKVYIHRSKKAVPAQSSNQVDAKQPILKLVTSKEHILQSYPDVFEGMGCFPGPTYHIQIDKIVTLKQTPCRPIWVHLKEAFQHEMTRYSKWKF